MTTPAAAAAPTASMAPPKPKGEAAALKHYEQTTQAMALKDRRKPPVSKRKPMRSLNPNEVVIPDGLRPDEKDKLLQEIKKKWQADFGQRIRYEESNRALREQVTKLTSRLEELDGGGSGVTGHHPPHPRDEVDEFALSGPIPGAVAGSKVRTRRSDAEWAKLRAAAVAGRKNKPVGPGGGAGAAGTSTGVVGLNGAAGALSEDATLRQTNIIVVLTRRNKELVAERKKAEEMLHLKTVQAETEGRRADKLESLLEAERVKATRDRVKLEQAIADSARAKATVDEHVRELEHQLEHAGRVRIALEHQVGGLREKLDSLMVDYSDVVTDLPDEDGFNVPTAAARKKASTNDPNDSEEEKLRQARLTLEYETWVSKKKEQAAHAHPGMVPRSRAPTKDHPGADETSPPPVTGAPSPVNGDADAARDAPNGSHPAAKPHHPAAGSHHPVAGLHHSDGTETTRPRKKTVGGTSKPVAHPDPAAAKKKEQEAARQEAEHMAKLQQEEEEHERERAKRAEEEIARQQAEMEAQQAEEERVRAEQEAAALEAAAKAREEEEAASKKWGKKKKK